MSTPSPPPNDPNPKRHIWAEYATKELETLEPLIPHVSIVCERSDAATPGSQLAGVGSGGADVGGHSGGSGGWSM